MAISLQQLTEAARNAAAIRTRTTLQPAGGDGDKVFPPTYLGSKYAEEVRIDPETGAEVKCVLLDSVQSQANRMEDALQAAVDSEQISLPLLVVDFGEAELIDEVRVLFPLLGISTLEHPLPVPPTPTPLLIFIEKQYKQPQS